MLNLTLRQCNVLLRNSTLPAKESKFSGAFPLFNKELFLGNLLALDARLSASQFQVNQHLVLEKLAKSSTSSSVLAQTQNYSRGDKSCGF